METRFKIAGIHRTKGDDKSYRGQLREIVKLDGAAGAGRTARIRFLAAQSALVLTDEYWRRFDEVKLVQPFEKNLKEKKRRMDAALEAYGRLVDYEVASVTAAATFSMAELYEQFGKALVDSERPAGLGPADLDEYAKALADEARPFQERALEIHEKNVELMASGIYDPWIEKSLARLAVLQPDRYGKLEARTGWLASLDRYAYEAPRTVAAPAPSLTRETAPAKSVPAAPDPGALDEETKGASDAHAP